MAKKEQEKLNPRSYVTILPWMVEELKLENLDLLIYAIIYGFCMDGKSDYHANISQRKPAIAILILDKVYFRASPPHTKKTIRQGRAFYIDSRVNPPRRHTLNVHAPDNRAAKHVRETDRS